MEDNRFKGRKGKKRLREINEHIEQMLGETEERYVRSGEMQAILEAITDPEVKLYFVTAYHQLYRKWHGMKIYGLLRLCRRWMNAKKITELRKSDVETMLEDILPSEDLQAVRQSTARAEEE